jgi:hypothetical protein
MIVIHSALQEGAYGSTECEGSRPHEESRRSARDRWRTVLDWLPGDPREAAADALFMSHEEERLQ